MAQERRYCRPSVVEERVLEIVDGRHPVLEQQLGSEFVANDCRFTAEDSLALITGPSRTADIEKILVQGAHGPRRLVLLLQTA